MPLKRYTWSVHTATYGWLLVNILCTLLKLGSYSSTPMCQYWDKCLIYWEVYWLFYWHVPIVTHCCAIVTTHFQQCACLGTFRFVDTLKEITMSYWQCRGLNQDLGNQSQARNYTTTNGYSNTHKLYIPHETMAALRGKCGGTWEITFTSLIYNITASAAMARPITRRKYWQRTEMTAQGTVPPVNSCCAIKEK